MDTSGKRPSDVDEGRLLLELTKEVTSSLDLQEVLDKSLASLRRLIDFNGGSIQLISDGHLQMVAGDPPPPPEAFEFRLPLGEGFGGRVAETGELIYSADATTDPRAHPEGRKRASVAGTHSWFGAPLIVHGETIGIVQLDDLEVDHFPLPVQARILSFLPIVSAAVQNALLFGRERDALTRLQEAERLKRDFVAVVSHELKTPLTIVQGFSSLIAAGSFSDDVEQLKTIGGRISGAARRLDEMISDVLHISGIESGGLSTDVQATDVAAVLRGSVAAADRGTHLISVELQSDLAPALTDASRLSQILAKLLDNAQKFSEAGTPIRVGASSDERNVVITVADQGHGIPPEMLERVFEPFLQVDSSESRAAGGMGSGLFVVKSLADAIDAVVSVTSEVSKGSEFTLRLATGRHDGH